MYTALIFTPLYNALVYLVGVVPGGDVGLAVIALTLLLKIALLPLSQKASKTQAGMRELQPKIDAIKKQHTKDTLTQVRKTQQLYKEAGISPFASFGLLLIQLPILIGLYQVFIHGNLTAPDPAYLYSFIEVPKVVGTQFLDFVDMYSKSIVLALGAGITQFWASQVMPEQAIGSEKNFANDFARSMQLQVKYVFPALITVVAYTTSAAVALFFIVSSLAQVAQEVYNTRTRKKA
jgi:YidC/Oxa1 family membrane protein insertase